MVVSFLSTLKLYRNGVKYKGEKEKERETKMSGLYREEQFSLLGWNVQCTGWGMLARRIL